MCLERGIVTAATIRDHRRPLTEGGTEALENEQPVCRACHGRKTAEEARRGRAR